MCEGQKDIVKYRNWNRFFLTLELTDKQSLNSHTSKQQLFNNIQQAIVLPSRFLDYWLQKCCADMLFKFSIILCLQEMLLIWHYQASKQFLAVLIKVNMYSNGNISQKPQEQ